MTRIEVTAKRVTVTRFAVTSIRLTRVGSHSFRLYTARGYLYMGCQRNTTTKSKKQVVRSEHMVVFGCDSHTCPFVFRLKAIVSGLELFRLFLCARQVAPRFATGCFATLASQHLLRTLASTLALPQLLRDTFASRHLLRDSATLASRHLLRDSATLASRHLLRDTCS